METRVAVWLAVVVTLVVALVLSALLTTEDRGVPCVDYVPANAACTPDSPAVLRGR